MPEIDPQSSPTKERLSFREKMFMGVSGTNAYIVNNIITGMIWMPVFNIGFGINAAVLGVIAMIFKAWDALLNPYVGNFSDNLRTRWGRRRPLIVIGALSTAALIPTIWWVPESLSQPVLISLLILYGLFLFTAYTVWIIPCEALAMEMTENYDERTSVMAYIAVFGKIIAVIGGWTMAFVTSDLFADSSGEPDLVHGIRFTSFILAAIFLTCGMIPGIFLREKNYATKTSLQKKEAFLTSLKETLSIRPLWILIAVIFLNLLGIVSISGLGYYINIYFVNRGDIAGASWIEGWRATAMFTVGLLSIPFWNKVSQWFDKRTALFFILGLTILGHLLNYFCLNPNLPYLQIIPSVLYSGVGSAIWMIAPSMKMDVADYDELQTGRRREGSINSIFSFILTLAVTLSTGISGFVLEASGFDPKLTEQTPETLQTMFYTYLFLPVAFWTASVLLLKFYKLNRHEMAEIRSNLNKQVPETTE